MHLDLFEVGRRYDRAEVAGLIDMPDDHSTGGAWMTGYSRWKDAIYVFCNVGVPGRTGHDYPNRWEGKELVWYGKTGTTSTQPLIRDMLSGDTPVHVFWRASNRTPFTYAGLGRAVDVHEGPPVEVRWTFGKAVTSTSLGSSAPRWRRGPRPTAGERSTYLKDGPTSVYVMSLAPDPRTLFPDLASDVLVIKVGMSNDPARRLDELNAGFPLGSRVGWTLVFTHEFPSRNDAYLAEGRALESLRTTDRWIEGEFGRTATSDLPDLLDEITGSTK